MNKLEYIGENFTPMKEAEAEFVSSLVLAFVGDSVYSTSVRHFLIVKTAEKAGKLSVMANKIVNAKAQANAYEVLFNIFSETEQNVAKRARNTESAHKAKNFSIHEYKRATGFEAVLGFLYLTGNKERLDFIIKKAIELAYSEVIK